MLVEFPVYLRLGPLAAAPALGLRGAGLPRRRAAVPGAEGAPGRPDRRRRPLVRRRGGRRSAAALGSKLLYWLSDPAVMLAHWHDPFFLMGGKSIVGGAGRRAARRSSGSSGASASPARPATCSRVPLAVGIAIGRDRLLPDRPGRPHLRPADRAALGRRLRRRHPAPPGPALRDRLPAAGAAPLLVWLRAPAAPRGRPVQAVHGRLPGLPAAAGVHQAGRRSSAG